MSISLNADANGLGFHHRVILGETALSLQRAWSILLRGFRSASALARIDESVMWSHTTGARREC